MTVHTIRTAAQLQVILQTLRRSLGMNQAALGRKVGLSQERISVIENHPERVSVDQLLTILSALGAEVVIQPRSHGIASTEAW